MSHFSKIFSKTPIDIPNRSGFDMSFENMLTMKVGTLTPILCEEVLPNETYSLGYLGQVQLPPMATDFFGRVDMRLEAFFVPNRVVWGGWQNFYTMPQNNPYSSPVVRPTYLPSVSISITDDNLSHVKEYFGSGSLADYLGVSTLDDALQTGNTISIPNALPFFAYHKIYDDWYRNSKIQKPVYINGHSNSIFACSVLPWSSDSLTANSFEFKFNDGTSLFGLRQRNYAKDRFTTASLYPQADGTVGGSKLSIDTSGEESSFTIAQLRQANVLQRWLERNNIAGERYADQIRATFGVYPSDAILDRSLYLGSSQFAIYNKSVYSTADTDPEAARSQSPFGATLGSKGASSNGVGQDTLISKFQSTEHGYLFVFASIVPHAQYSTGMRPTFRRSKVGDFANPLLQGLGEQAIYISEFLGPFFAPSDDTEFGYQQQYSEYKYHNDELHGLLRDDESLQSFALQRSFSKQVAPILGTDFIQISPSDMDNVTAVKSQLSQFGAWADFYLSLKKVSPLSEYVIPTLGDVKNTHKESVPYRGTML